MNNVHLKGKLKADSIISTPAGDLEKINLSLLKLKSDQEAMQEHIDEKEQSIDIRIIDLQQRQEQTDSDIEDIIEMIKGRPTGYVFDTVADMNLWLQVQEHIDKLNVGDTLYIIASDVPDYWWDGTQVRELETQKVDLSNIYNKNEVYNKLEIQNLINSTFNNIMGGAY